MQHFLFATFCSICSLHGGNWPLYMWSELDYVIKPLLRSGTIPPCYIHVWAMCTDAGPDQLAFRGSIKTLMSQEDFCNQLCFDVLCVKHQLHLLVKDGMKYANTFCSFSAPTTPAAQKKVVPYLSAMAQIVHCWRAHSKKLNQIYNAVVPDAWRHKASVAIPPVAIAGRCSVDCYLANTPGWMVFQYRIVSESRLNGITSLLIS